MDQILLGQLCHDSQGISSEFVPYATARLKSHYLAHAAHPADIRLCLYPSAFTHTYLEERPSLVGFSNFMWNLDLACGMAARIKQISPQTLIVFGGPNFPLETPRQEQWLRDRPMVDLHIVGEGEQPFLEVAEKWFECRSIEDVKRAGVYGAYSLVQDRILKVTRSRQDGFDDYPRIHNLDSTPSPYLMGYLDEFLADGALVPLIECNRGCPFSCTFCVDGIDARTNVHKASFDRLRDEIAYIAQRYAGQNLMIADSNFGMYAEDVRFAEMLAEVQSKYNYPRNIIASTGKNQHERILKVADLLRGALRVSAAVQSLDSEVLASVRRSNISYDKLVEISRRASGSEANTYSEVILALPSDSKQKHFQTVSRLIDTGLNQIRLHTLMVLDGSELGTGLWRDRCRLNTRFRLIPRCFGVYPFGPHAAVRSAEIEEVCVENATMPFEDYLECRRFALTVTLFYNDNTFIELAHVLARAGCKVSDWLAFVHARLPPSLPRLQAIYSSYMAATVHELSRSREELSLRIKNQPGALEAAIDGGEGFNVLLTHQARANLECVDELNQAAFHCLHALLHSSAGPALFPPGYLAGLERYSLGRKAAIMDFDTVLEQDFDYDFLALEESGFSADPASLRSPSRIAFAYLPWQKELLGDQVRRFGASPQGWCRILSRVPIKKIRRRATRLPGPLPSPGLQYNTAIPTQR